MYRRNSEIDMENVKAFLEDAVTRVKTQENPEVLDEVKKVFKKNVPFSLRMYVASYLVKEAQKHYRPSYSYRRDYSDRNSRYQNERINPRERKPYNSEKFSNEERPSRPRVHIDPSLASTIFISIGRNRRVFPRDLVGLLISVAGLEKERIGDIRVLANYSFVQLFTEDADKAINALNGYDYRGRKLSVSYSKMKDDEQQDSFASQTDDRAEDEFDEQAAEDAAAYAAAEKAAANKEPFSAPNITPEN